MKDSLAYSKSFQFSLLIISLYRELLAQHEYIISKQLLRSATSIGANITEAIGGESTKDFLHKLQIALKEARESRYWLLLLQESNLVNLDFSPALKEAEQLVNILSKSVKTTKLHLSP